MVKEDGCLSILICRNSRNTELSLSDLLPKILMQEILLTEDEVKLLQNDQSNKMLPRMLLIFDNYDEIHENFKEVSNTNSNLWLEISFIERLEEYESNHSQSNGGCISHQS